ncbi:MAG: hypothetical protein GX595_08890 [Lentisphaerae bacterium]|nr:hypothetical protein [Lentisphaerota bacterium]
MLEVSLEHALVFLTTAFLGGLFCLGLYDSWRDRWRGWTLREEYLGECSRCRLMFLVSRYETVVRCPRCQTLMPTPRRVENRGGSKRRQRQGP